MDDDAWGAGPSYETVAVCEECGDNDLDFLDKEELTDADKFELCLEEEE